MMAWQQGGAEEPLAQGFSFADGTKPGSRLSGEVRLQKAGLAGPTSPAAEGPSPAARPSGGASAGPETTSAGAHFKNVGIVLGATAVGLAGLYGVNQLGQGSSEGGIITCSPRRCVVGAPNEPCFCEGNVVSGAPCGETETGVEIGGECSLSQIGRARRSSPATAASARIGSAAVPSTDTPMKPFRAPGWLTGVAIAAVAAVNLAGLWGIAVARQGAIDEARRTFGVDVTSRATALESRLSAGPGGPGLPRRVAHDRPPRRRPAQPRGGDASCARARRARCCCFCGATPRWCASWCARPTPVPSSTWAGAGACRLLWVSSSPTGEEGAAVDPTRPRLTATLPHEQEAGLAGGVTIETEVDPSALVDATAASPDEPRYCMLSDASGAHPRPPPGPAPPRRGPPRSGR